MSQTVPAPESALILPGVFLRVYDCGLLLSGRSGIGKSRLALELVARGHALIADDAPIFSHSTAVDLIGEAAPGLSEFLFVRGAGSFNVERLFGAEASARRARLDLIVRFAEHADPSAPVDPLGPAESVEQHMGVDVRTVTIAVADPSCCPGLVEALALDHAQRMQGYDAARDLAARVRRSLY